MCGRFSLVSAIELIKKLLQVDDDIDIEPRYNIAPSQEVFAVPQSPERELFRYRWGLIPSWSKNESIGNKMINARAETLFEKPAYRGIARYKRCLIPADGFFEWRAEDGKKQPYYFFMKDKQPFAFGGLWDTWERGESPISSCTIITTEPNDLLKEYHNRMPLIIPQKSYEEWLDVSVKRPEQIKPLLVPYAAKDMDVHPVSKMVNNPTRDDAECIAPIEG